MSDSPERTTFSSLWKQKDLLRPILVILAVVAIVYSRAVQNGILLWDDGWHVTHNPDIQSLAMENIKKIFSSFYGNMYHPLTTLTFAIEYWFFGLNPIVFHITNILFHMANVLLVFFFTFRLSGRREIASIVALLFGIHPMHVESVAWITERKDVVYAFFYLLSLITYVRFVKKEGNKYYWIAFLFFLLSLLSKTTALTLPLILLLLDFYLGRKLNLRTVAEKLPMFLCSIVFGIIALYSQTNSMNYVHAIGINIVDRFFYFTYSVYYYGLHALIPMDLSALHLMPEKINGFLPTEYYLTVIPVLVLIVLCIRKGKLQREYIFGLLFFFITLSLSLHIVPVGMAIVAERYTYIPYLGLYFILGRLFCYFFDCSTNFRYSTKIGIQAAAGVLVIILGILTFHRIGTWKDTETLFQDAAGKAHTVYEAQYVEALGDELQATESLKLKKYPEAISWYDKVIALNPKSVESFTNRGIAKQCLLDYEGAMEDYTRAIEINPLMPRAYPNRAAIYLQWNKQKEACADLWAAYNLGLRNVFQIMRVNCP